VLNRPADGAAVKVVSRLDCRPLLLVSYAPAEVSGVGVQGFCEDRLRTPLPPPAPTNRAGAVIRPRQLLLSWPLTPCSPS